MLSNLPSFCRARLMQRSHHVNQHIPLLAVSSVHLKKSTMAHIDWDVILKKKSNFLIKIQAKPLLLLALMIQILFNFESSSLAATPDAPSAEASTMTARSRLADELSLKIPDTRTHDSNDLSVADLKTFSKFSWLKAWFQKSWALTFAGIATLMLARQWVASFRHVFLMLFMP